MLTWIRDSLSGCAEHRRWTPCQFPSAAPPRRALTSQGEKNASWGFLSLDRNYNPAGKENNLEIEKIRIYNEKATRMYYAKISREPRLLGFQDTQGRGETAPALYWKVPLQWAPLAFRVEMAGDAWTQWETQKGSFSWFGYPADLILP